MFANQIWPGRGSKVKVKSDSDLFTILCEAQHISVEETVYKALARASVTGLLDLSGVSMMQETCEALGEILSETSVIFSVNFSDCLLSPSGLTAILCGLGKSTNIVTVILKGNNIAGPSIARVGTMLQRSNSVKRLSLEWNSLGLYPELFQTFCSALSKNTVLTELDLQNNQLSSDCAAILSESLSKNSTLKSLDLRWNSLGWQGGQFLLQILQENKSVTSIKLQGNRIPPELMQTLEQCVSCNLSKEKIAKESNARNKFLAKQLHKAQIQKAEEVETLMRQTERAVREMEIKLKATQDIVLERDAAIAATEAQLNQLQMNFEKANKKIEELQTQLALASSQAAEREAAIRTQTATEKTSLQEEVEVLRQRARDLELEKKTKETALKTQRLEAKSAAEMAAQKLLEAEERLKSELRVVRMENDSQLEMMRKLNKEELDEAVRNAEERVKVSATERALKAAEDRIVKAIADGDAKVAAIEKSAALSAAIASENAAEAMRVRKRLEERIQSLETLLAEAERRASSAATSATSELRRVERERDSERSRADDAEVRAERLIAEKRELAKRYDAEVAARTSAEQERDSERARLLGQLQNVRAEEARRASALYAAFTSYLAPQALSVIPS